MLLAQAAGFDRILTIDMANSADLGVRLEQVRFCSTSIGWCVTKFELIATSVGLVLKYRLASANLRPG